MKKINNIITKILYGLIIINFSILIIACVLQVFTRFVLNSSLSWTEELARYTFIWSNMLGAVLCTKNKSNAKVTVITDNISESKQIVLSRICDVISIIIGIIIAIYGARVAMAVKTQLTPALRISNFFVFASAPVFGILLVFYSIYDIYEDYLNKRERS
ncbi:TRAP transporter small permease [Peptoniphilus sp.]|jgi:TRAP-type C4-dicarboxylate transport system permease small subunit|uniref:TRAP transporter small permease n=1 Tax=Peptoniphilus sp. TaxID=1971214 RepID=UPI003D8D5F86